MAHPVSLAGGCRGADNGRLMSTTSTPGNPGAQTRAETQSGIAVSPVYAPADLGPDWAPDQRLGAPGGFPFTRGPHATMYRGKPWTMRMFSGYGTPEDTNRRFHFLLSQGQTGLSTAFDMPTLMGFDLSLIHI